MAVTRDLWIVLRARDEATRIIRSFGNNLGNSTAGAVANMTQFQSVMADAAQRMQQFAMTSMLMGSAMAGLGAAGIHFIHGVTQVAAEYDRQVRATKTQVDDLSISLEDLAQVGRDVAREVQIPFEQMQETLFFIFSSMDVNINEARDLLRGFAKEAVAGQTTVEAAAKTTIAIMNSLGLSVADLTRIQDVQFQVVRKGIITYEELAQTIGRALPATARSGQSIETLGAMMAFLTRNGLSAAMATTSAARALESFAHPKTVGRLQDMGIKVRDMKGEFLPLVDVMEQMNKKFSKLAAPERAKFLQELFTGAGGTIQARRFWDVAFKNFGEFEEMIGHMANSSGVFEESYRTMAGSVAAQTELLRNKWMLIKEALGRAVLPHFMQFLKMLERALDWFERLPPGTKEVIAQFILWGSVMSVALGILIILIGSLAFFVSGIMMAGTALLGVIAAIVGITAALVGFGLAFKRAWEESQNFREAMLAIADVLEELWGEVTSFGRAVQEAFDQKLRPSIEKFWKVVNDRLLPIFVRFVQVVKEEVLPKIVEAKNLIIDFTKSALEYVADIVDNFVIPALEKMAKWWEENEDTVRPFLKVAAQVVKWLLVIAAVLFAIPFLLIATAVAVVIAVITGLIIALKTLWGWITTAFNAVREFFAGVSRRIMDFVMSVVNFFEPAFRRLVTIVSEVTGLISDIIKFWVTLIVEIFKDWIMPIVNKVAAIWMEGFNKIKTFLTAVLNHIKAAFKLFTDAAMFLWNTYIKDIVDKWLAGWNKVKKFVMDIWDEIKGFFGNAGSMLFDAGQRIIQGLIDGITDKIRDLRKKLQEITDMIPDLKGPKAKDLKLLVPVGKHVMQGFMDGIESQLPMIKAQLQGVTASVGQLPTQQFTVPTGFFDTPGESRVFNQYITINTQEIDPRIHGMEIGWELERRM